MSDMNETTKAETNRDRVRRLLIEPLTRDGMRFPREVSDEVQRKRLDQMADDLGHMSDANLVRLRLCLRSKGGGSAKCFWPGRVTDRRLCRGCPAAPHFGRSTPAQLVCLCSGPQGCGGTGAAGGRVHVLRAP